jgi:hypothetical protein
MRWRPLASSYSDELEESDAYEPDEAEVRAAVLSQALARLEAATRLRDGDAAARVLAGLADTEDGQWLLRQCVAAGLRDVARHIADPTFRSIGPAA